MASSRISRGGHRPEAFTAGRREEGDRIFMVDGGDDTIVMAELFLCAR
jgi:hypothetical protein